MNALAISFSARPTGSCSACLGHCLDRLSGLGFRTDLVLAGELDIRPCGRCEYQCMRGRDGALTRSCPVDDDVMDLYRAVIGADVLLMAVPTYWGQAAALYRAFAERAQMLPGPYLERLDGVLKGVVVIGNAAHGGGLALQGVLASWQSKLHPEALLLSASDYGQRSPDGGLAEEAGVLRRLDLMVDRLIGRAGC